MASGLLAADGSGLGELSYSFVEIENLQGGEGADTFTIEAAHSGNLVVGAGNDTFEINAVVTGEVQGGAGADILDVRAIAGPLTLYLGADNDSLMTPDYRGRVVRGARDSGEVDNTELLVSYKGIERYAGGESAYLLVGVLEEGNLVVNPQSSTPAEDRPSDPLPRSLTQNQDGDRLQTLDEFLGPVLIGGTLFPA